MNTQHALLRMILSIPALFAGVTLLANTARAVPPRHDSSKAMPLMSSDSNQTRLTPSCESLVEALQVALGALYAVGTLSVRVLSSASWRCLAIVV